MWKTPLLSAHQKSPFWILGGPAGRRQGSLSFRIRKASQHHPRVLPPSYSVILSPKDLLLIRSALRGAGRGISGHDLGVAHRQVVDGQTMGDADSFLKAHKSWARGHRLAFTRTLSCCVTHKSMLVRTPALVLLPNQPHTTALPQGPPWSACIPAL